MQAPKLSFSCPARDQVVGDGPVRFCHLCDRAVHDLSAMTEAEAERFLALCGTQDLCVSARVVEGRVQHTSQLGRISLALGLGLGGLAVAQVVRTQAAGVPDGVGGAVAILRPPAVGGAAGLLHTLAPDGTGPAPTAELRATVRAALAEAEAGWPAPDTSPEARRRRATELVPDLTRAPRADAHEADANAPSAPPPVPRGDTLLGTFPPRPPALEPIRDGARPPVDDVLLGSWAPGPGPDSAGGSGRDREADAGVRLGRRDILPVVRAAAPAVAACGGQAPARTITVALTIGPDGTVTRANVLGLDAQPARCVGDVVRAMRFPAFDDEPMHFNMPFRFGTAP